MRFRMMKNKRKKGDQLHPAPSVSRARVAGGTGTTTKRRSSASTASPALRQPSALTIAASARRGSVRGIGFTRSSAICQPR